jgi:glyoxylase-like metal-dependent hydrolase (beta-lactamase superfamily II)
MTNAVRGLRVGNVQLVALLDSSALCDIRSFLPEFAGSMIEEYKDVLDELPLVRLPTICWLVRSSGQTILVDTGIGGRGRPGQVMGHLDQRLRDVNVAPGEITTIVTTHMHSDHVGWNTVDGPDGAPRPFFPNARFLWQTAEWDYWTQPAKLAEPGNDHLSECVVAPAEMGRVTFVDGEDAITPELTFVPTPGHTPGHVAVGIYSSGERAIMIGDVSHHPVQVTHPDWSVVWDADPAQAARTRDRLFDHAMMHDQTVLTNHWPYPGFGRIVAVKSKRIFSPGDAHER